MSAPKLSWHILLSEDRILPFFDSLVVNQLQSEANSAYFKPWTLKTLSENNNVYKWLIFANSDQIILRWVLQEQPKQNIDGEINSVQESSQGTERSWKVRVHRRETICYLGEEDLQNRTAGGCSWKEYSIWLKVGYRVMEWSNKVVSQWLVLCVQKLEPRAGEMIQWLRIISALAKDPGWILSSTVAHNHL